MPSGDLRRRFTQHEVSPAAAEAMDRNRAAGFELASVITAGLVDCDERRRVLDAVDDAVMRANAGLARLNS